jgi:hypothetical protein
MESAIFNGCLNGGVFRVSSIQIPAKGAFINISYISTLKSRKTKMSLCMEDDEYAGKEVHFQYIL